MGYSKRASAAAMLSVALVALAGCGTKAGETLVRETLNTFYAAASGGDAKTACDLLTQQERARQGFAQCERQILRTTRRMGVTGTPKVDVVEVGGSKASANVGLKSGSHRVLLQKESGKEWKISRL